MDMLEQRATELRAEIDRLKSALLAATDEDKRFELHGHINACIRESLGIIEQRLQASQARSAVPLHERQLGKD